MLWPTNSCVLFWVSQVMGPVKRESSSEESNQGGEELLKVPGMTNQAEVVLGELSDKKGN